MWEKKNSAWKKSKCKGSGARTGWEQGVLRNSKAGSLEQSRREGRGRRRLHRGRLGKERSSRALRAIIGSQAFTLRTKGALLRRELLRVLRREVVCGLLF